MASHRTIAVVAVGVLALGGSSLRAAEAFREAFDAPAAVQFWARGPGEWAVRDGTYQETSQDYRTVSLRPGLLYDFDLTVRVSFVAVRREYETAGYAVVAFRAQDTDRYYALILRQKGTLEVSEFNRRPSEKRSMWQPIAESSGQAAELALAKWYVVELQVRGMKVSARAFEQGAEPGAWQVEADLSADGEFDHRGPAAYARGRIGLGASHARVSFDDLDVRPQPSVAEFRDVLSAVRARAEQAQNALAKGPDKDQAKALLDEIDQFARGLPKRTAESSAERDALAARVAALDGRAKSLRKRALLERGGLAVACPYARLGGTTAHIGDLNLHTNHSDGGKYPDEAARYYEAAGYGLVCFADEDAYGDQDGGVYHPRLQNDTHPHDWNADGQTYDSRLYGSGLEAYVRDYASPPPPWVAQDWKIDRPGEFAVLSGVTYASGHPAIACIGYPAGPAFRPREGYGFLDVLHRAGGVAFLCHPAAYNATPEDVYGDENLRRLDGLEIYNGYFARRKTPEGNEDGGAGIATRLWDACLDHGLRMWGFANDDCHSFDPAGADSPFNGFNVAWTRDLTREAVLEALREGRFYASSGIVVDHIDVTASTLRVRAKAATYIRVIGRGGRELASADAGELTYELDGSERWLRVQLQNDTRVVPEKTYTQQAWLQPIFVDDLLEGRAGRRTDR